jgi:hypothetical protein
MALLKYWDGAQWVVAPNGAVTALDDLSDVTLTAAANDDFLQRKSGLWVNRTLVQVRTDLTIALNNLGSGFSPTSTDDSGDGYGVGSIWINTTAHTVYICVDATVNAASWKFLGYIESVGAGLSVSGTALSLDADLVTIAGLTATTDNFMQAKASAWASRTPAQVRVDLATPKCNSTTSAPGTGNDNTQGYAVGSIWVNTTTALAYVATSVATGAAAWRLIDYVVSASSPLAVDGSGVLTLPAAAGPSTNGYLLGTDKAKLDKVLFDTNDDYLLNVTTGAGRVGGNQPGESNNSVYLATGRTVGWNHLEGHDGLWLSMGSYWDGANTRRGVSGARAAGLFLYGSGLEFYFEDSGTYTDDPVTFESNRYLAPTSWGTFATVLDPPRFRAFQNANQSVPGTAVWTKLLFASVSYNHAASGNRSISTVYDTATSVFTAPADGVYAFTAYTYITSAVAAPFGLRFLGSGDFFGAQLILMGGTSDAKLSIAAEWNMTAGQTVQVEGYNGSGTAKNFVPEQFTGRWVSEL